jgi:tRNA A-37 threonylcarbamoyl transferase component Bud32
MLNLIKPVAQAVRHMHDSGFKHGDLGNQNIMLSAKDYALVQFIDLNRGKICKLNMKDRAFDISRIALPPFYLKLFKQIYWGKASYSLAFDLFEKYYRARFAWHTITRKWRHPIRTLCRPTQTEQPVYPDYKQLNVWDEQSKQAIKL